MNNDDDVKYDEYCSRCLTIFNTDNDDDDDVKYNECCSRCLTIFNTDDNDDEVKLNEYCSRCLNNIQYWVCPRIDFWDPPLKIRQYSIIMMMMLNMMNIVQGV